MDALSWYVDEVDEHKRRHDGCGGELWSMDGVDFCQGCGAQGEAPSEAGP